MNQPTDAGRIPSGWERASQPDLSGQERTERPDGSAAFSILIVCTGNICRSPLAEQLLAAGLAPAGMPVSIISAGTRALVGHPMTPEAAELSLLYGGDPSAHRAQQLTPEMVENADLILAATRDHRGDIVQVSPGASRRAFTLRQFARIVAAGVQADVTEPDSENDDATGAALRAYVGAVAGSRGFVPPPLRAGDDDIEDPYRRSKQVYRRSAGAINDAVGVISAGLIGAARGR